MHGTTSILPTVMADRFSVMRNSVKSIDTASKSKMCKSNIIGAHLEGPYLSKKQCGAQSPSFITLPVAKDYESLVKEYHNSIARWTFAPENDRNGQFCSYISSFGITASAGHTDADFNEMMTAYNNGCRLITHLYSCTSTITRKNGFRRLGVKKRYVYVY